jgi:hypothetical protein
MNDLRDKLGNHAFRYYDLWHTIKNNWQDSVVITLALLMFAFSAFVYFSDYNPKGKMYDCSIAEISPDYPVQVKEACRKARSESK